MMKGDCNIAAENPFITPILTLALEHRRQTSRSSPTTTITLASQEQCEVDHGIHEIIAVPVSGLRSWDSSIF
jgi:hypothetical protein